MSTAAKNEAARFFAPEKAFDRPVPAIPAMLFSQQRAQAFAPDAITGFIDCDISAQIETDWPATTPTLLARYLVIRAGETIKASFHSSGEVFHVIRGSGQTRCDGACLAWGARDSFCLPGGKMAIHDASEDAILLQVTNEPELRYLRAVPAQAAAVAPTLFPFAEAQAHLRAVHGRNGEQRAAGKSVIFLSALMHDRRVTTPTMLAAINSLEPGGDQRAHAHSSVALTLGIESEGVFSRVDGQQLDWEADTLFITPPGCIHSHHNRGSSMMLSFVVQDTALHTQLRTTNFQWKD